MKQQLHQEELLSQAMDLIVESGADLKTLFDQDGLLKKLTSLYAKGVSVSDIKM